MSDWSDSALEEIERAVDKIRYACDPKLEQQYVQELLKLFDPQSGDYIGPP